MTTPPTGTGGADAARAAERESSAVRTDAMRRYQQANAYLNEGLIRIDSQPYPGQPSRRELMSALLPSIGDPQASYPAIHVAGTSGKGSVSAMIAEILHASGLRSGLHVSPYVQLATEKLWVAGRYASADEYAALVDWFRPVAERMRTPQLPLHGMASVALCLEHFRRHRVDVAVIEAGVGGRRDLTTVANTRVAVVTNVGLDHQRTLGPTLQDIAWHKVGVIRPGSRAVVLAPNGTGPLEPAARRAAQQADAPLRFVRSDQYGAQRAADGSLQISFRGTRLQLQDAPLAFSGQVQAHNAALALAACEEFDPDGRWVTAASARAGLARARLPARQEWFLPHERYLGPSPPCALLLDGAHNDDKLRALFDALDRRRFDRVHLVYGTLHGKETDGMIDSLAGRLTSVVVTEPQVYGKAPRPAAEVADRWTQSGAPQRVSVQRDPSTALDRALDRARPSDLVVVTGSFYLAGMLRGRWYPDDAVLTQQTSWPVC